MQFSVLNWKILASMKVWPSKVRFGFQAARDRSPDFDHSSSLDYPKELPRLNVGGGKGHPRVPGWAIVDLRESADHQLNVSEDRLPYDDDSVAVVFTSHMLERIYPFKLGHVLDEFYRVLIPGGLLRILVPDIRLAMAAYMAQDISFFENTRVGHYDPAAPIGGLLASWFYSSRTLDSAADEYGFGHVHCFDFDYLKHWLQRSGFREIAESSFQGSRCSELRGDAFDRHPNESLIVECLK